MLPVKIEGIECYEIVGDVDTNGDGDGPIFELRYTPTLGREQRLTLDSTDEESAKFEAAHILCAGPNADLLAPQLVIEWT